MTDVEPEPQPTDEPNPLRQLREALDRSTADRKAVEAQLAEANEKVRELAFLKAKVNTDSPIGKLFVKSYDGDLETDAIAAAWAELSPPTPPSEPPPPNPSTEPETDEARLARLGLADARNGLNAGGSPPGAEPDEDPIDRALVDGRAAGPRGSDRAIQAYSQRIIDAAVAGDARVAHSGPMDDATRLAWMEAARRRQVANNEQSKYQ